MPKPRKVDKVAKKTGGLLEALRRRRESVEKGTMEGLSEAPHKFVSAISKKDNNR